MKLHSFRVYVALGALAVSVGLLVLSSMHQPVTSRQVAPLQVTAERSEEGRSSVPTVGVALALSQGSVLGCTAPVCTASGGWSGTQPLTGTSTVTPAQTTTYILTCTGDGGSANKSVTVSVTGGDGAVCGNGVREGSEQCDGSSLGGQSCQSMGYTGGTLSCNTNCTFNTNNCTTGDGAVCGNNICETGETATSCPADCGGGNVVYELHVVKAGIGSGTINSSPAGISNCTGTCTATFNSGTFVNLTATPAVDVTLSWSGCTVDPFNPKVCRVLMDAAKTVTATFTPVGHSDYTLSVTPTSRTIAQGMTTTYAVSVNRSSYTGTIQFSSTGQTAGTSITFSPLVCVSSCTSVEMRAAVSSTAALGTQTIKILGTSNTLIRSVNAQLIVHPKPTVAFTLRPRATHQPVVFDWSVTGGQALKQVELWRSPDLNGQPEVERWIMVGTPIIITGTGGSGTLTDNPSPNTWWYGLHVVNQTGETVAYEPNPPGPLKTVKTATEGPDFTITATPASLTLAPGASQDVTLTAQSTGGFNSLVTFEEACAENADGIGCVFPSGNSCTPGANGTCSKTVKISVNTGVFPGTQHAVITAFSVAPAITQQIDIPVTVGGSSDSLAPTVTLFITSNTTMCLAGSVTLTWLSHDNVGVSRVEVWHKPTGADWARIVTGACAGDKAANGSCAVSPSATTLYGLHVLDVAGNCINESGGHCGGVPSDTSDPRVSHGPDTVTVNAPPAAKPGNPTYAQTTQTSTTVSWTLSAGAPAHDLYRCIGSTCTRPSTAHRLAVTSPFTDTGLTCGTTYRYWIGARNTCGTTLSDQGTAVTTAACTLASFTITATPASLTLAPGASQDVTLTAQSTGGFNSLVTFEEACAENADGIGCVFPSGNSCTPGANGTCSKTVKISVNTGVFPGTQHAVITAFSVAPAITQQIDIPVTVGGSPSDTTPPQVVSFFLAPFQKTDPVKLEWKVTDNVALDHLELWRAPFAQTGCNDTSKTGCVWQHVVGADIAVSGTAAEDPPFLQDTPAVGTWWYGMHVVDQAGNVGNEQTPVKVVYGTADTTAPALSVSGFPPKWVNTNMTAGVTCTDSGTGCDPATLRLVRFTGLTICPQTYASYTLTSPQTVSSHGYYCAAGKDLEGNTGFSTAIEFKVDKTAPTATSFTGSGVTCGQIVWTIAGAQDQGGSLLHAQPYSFDNGATWQSGATFTQSVPGGGSVTRIARARDNAGNVWTSSSVSATTTTCTLASFTITATPASRTVAKGTSATYALAIIPSGGFASAVGAWTVANCPAGANCAVNPGVCLSTSYATCGTLTITTGFMAPGTYTNITASALGSGITRTSPPVSLTVTVNAL